MEHVDVQLRERLCEHALVKAITEACSAEVKSLENAIHDIASPIKRLPLEIMSTILLEATADERLPNSSHSSKKTFLSCTLTCRDWYSLVISNPRFWTTVTFRVGQTTQTAFTSILLRSKGLPINMTLNCTPPNHTVSDDHQWALSRWSLPSWHINDDSMSVDIWSWQRLMKEHVKRVKHINVIATPSQLIQRLLPIPVGFLALECLSIRQVTNVSSYSSEPLPLFSDPSNLKLRSLKISGKLGLMAPPTPMLSTTRANIEELVLSEVVSLSLNTVLHLFPNLRSLECPGNRSGEPPLTSGEGGSLVRLVIRGSLPLLPPLPELQELYLSWRYYEASELPVSLPKLRTLGISGRVGRHLRTWFAACPELRDLIMEFAETVHLTDLVSNAVGSPEESELAPKLETIHLYCGSNGDLRGTDRSTPLDVMKITDVLCEVLTNRQTLSMTVSYSGDVTPVRPLQKIAAVANIFPGRLSLVEAEGPPSCSPVYPKFLEVHITCFLNIPRDGELPIYSSSIPVFMGFVHEARLMVSLLMFHRAQTEVGSGSKVSGLDFPT